MKKKQLRDIVVDEIPYKWHVRNVGGYGPVLTIWESRNSKIYQGDVPLIEVTPKYVAEKIEEYR